MASFYNHDNMWYVVRGRGREKEVEREGGRMLRLAVVTTALTAAALAFLKVSSGR